MNARTASETPTRIAPLIRLRGVTKTYGRARRLAGAQGHGPRHRRRRIRRHHGPQRLGQVHRDEHPGLPGHARPPAQYLFQGVHVEALSRDQRARLRRRYLGFVFQGFNLLARTSAQENVELPLLYRGEPPPRATPPRPRRWSRWAWPAGSTTRPAELSGGQQQRVAIARAIVTEPAVLLADEPTGNLDTQRSHEIMGLLWRLNVDHGITVLMVTHEPDMAAYARRIVRFVDGVVGQRHAQPAPGRPGQARGRPHRRARPPDAAQHPAAGAALDPAQPAALVPDHPGHRDRRERGDHHGHAGQRRHAGGAEPDLRPGHQPAAGAPGPAHGSGGGGGGAPPFKEADAEAIASQIGGIAAVAPEARTGATVVANGRNWTTSVIGSTNAWFDTGNWKLGQGREFSDDELRAGAAVCLIGETVRRELFGSARRRLGEQLRVKQISCDVIGLLASKGQGAIGNDQDDVVLVPLKTLQRRITGNTRVNTLLVSMADGSDANRVKASLTAAAARAPQAGRHRRGQFQRARHQAAGRDAVGHHQGHDHAAGRGGGREPAGGRHRHHEHHAGQRDRAHPRDRPAPGHRRAGARGAAAVPDRGGGAGRARRPDRHRAGHRCVAGAVAS